MRHQMKQLFIIASLIFSFSNVYSQKATLLDKIFEDSSNFEITKSLNHQYPEKYFLLVKTDFWNKNRFINDSTENRHAESPNPLIFSDSLLGKLLSQKDKEHLLSKAIHIESYKIKRFSSNIHLIKSFKNIPNGFFFSITEPIYYNSYSLINLTVYFKDLETKSLKETYFGQVLFVYQYRNNSWTLIKKIDDLLL